MALGQVVPMHPALRVDVPTFVLALEERGTLRRYRLEARLRDEVSVVATGLLAGAALGHSEITDYAFRARARVFGGAMWLEVQRADGARDVDHRAVRRQVERRVDLLPVDGIQGGLQRRVRPKIRITRVLGDGLHGHLLRGRIPDDTNGDAMRNRAPERQRVVRHEQRDHGDRDRGDQGGPFRPRPVPATPGHDWPELDRRATT